MGTIVAVCMFVGVIFALRLPVLEGLPRWINRIIGATVLLAGLWNALWYGLQHITEFWGYSALVSGILLIITGLYILDVPQLPDGLRRLRIPVLVLLFCYGLLYAITIARL